MTDVVQLRTETEVTGITAWEQGAYGLIILEHRKRELTLSCTRKSSTIFNKNK